MISVALMCFTLSICPSHREGTHHAVQPEPRGGQATAELPIDVGRRMAADVGWTGSEWLCLAEIGRRESGWSVTAVNSRSGATGVGQALPASKMAAYGADYLTSAATQVRWMLAYVKARYGTPCGALAYWNRNGSY